MPITSEALQARREISKAAGVRISKRKIPRQREPKAAQLKYQQLLTAMRKTLERLLREELFPELPGLVEQGEVDRGGVRRDAATDDLLRVFSKMRILFANAHPEAVQTITEVSSDVNALQSVEHQKQMKAALGLEVIIPEPFVQSALGSFIADNQNLVTSLFDEQFKSFQTITSKGIRSGLRVESIRDELIDKLGVSKSRASLLARDQTLKLFGEMNQLRQTNVGITEYTWDTSQDGRVRPRHGELHGTIQKWSDPPIVDYKSGRQAHPGGDYQCRCQGIPIIPEEFLGGEVEPKPPVESKVPTPKQNEAARKAWERKITVAERKAVHSWTDIGYDSLRQMDRGQRKKSARYRALDSALKKAPKVRSEVYRGIGGLSEAELQALAQKGAIIEHDALASWSLERQVAKRFSKFGNVNQRTGKLKPSQGRAVFKVKTEKGIDVSGISDEPDEKEIILLKNKYRVVQAKKRVHKKTREVLFWEIELEEI